MSLEIIGRSVDRGRVRGDRLAQPAADVDGPRPVLQETPVDDPAVGQPEQRELTRSRLEIKGGDVDGKGRSEARDPDAADRPRAPSPGCLPAARRQMPTLSSQAAPFVPTTIVIFGAATVPSPAAAGARLPSPRTSSHAARSPAGMTPRVPRRPPVCRPEQVAHQRQGLPSLVNELRRRSAPGQLRD
jgi:hypothetical protein